MEPPPPPPSLLEDLKSPLYSTDYANGGTTEDSLLLLVSSPLAFLQGLVSAMVRGLTRHLHGVQICALAVLSGLWYLTLLAVGQKGNSVFHKNHILGTLDSCISFSQ